jgi:peptidyl-prolyl cis-trans isomerase A (cyclophilin A)
VKIVRWLAVLVVVAGVTACSSPKTEEKAPAARRVPVEVPAQYQVRFDTTKGPFTVEVVREWAPRGADRFHELVRTGFFDGARLYRVRPKFVVQFGISPDAKTNELWKQLKMPDDPVKQSNQRGFISYATDGPRTRTTEVFINLADNKRLDTRGFSPFGRVVEGMDVVDQFYSGYGEVQPMGGGPDPVKMQTIGDEYIQRGFPRMDQIRSAKIVQ